MDQGAKFIHLLQVGLAGTSLVVLALLAFSAAVGFVLFRLVRRSKSPSLRWGVTALGGLVMFLVAGAVLFFRSQVVPAVDDFKFSSTSSVKVAIRAGTGSPSFVQLTTPKSLRINEDVEVELLLGTGFSGGTPYATLIHGPDIVVRPVESGRNCVERLGATIAHDGAGKSVRSCGETLSDSTISYRWILRSEKPGASRADFLIPHEFAEEVLVGEWSATVRVDGKLLDNGALDMDFNIARISSRESAGEDPVVLDAHSPRIDIERVQGSFTERLWKVSLAPPVLSSKIEFRTTLGLTAEAYDLVALLGAVLSGLLGGGWLWQLLGKRRPPDPPSTPQQDFHRIKSQKGPRRSK